MCRQCVSVELSMMLDCVRTCFEQCGEFSLDLPFDVACDSTPPTDRIKPIPPRRPMVFPTTSVAAGGRVVALLRLAQLIIGNLDRGVFATIRDIYYKDVNLFTTQSVVVWAIEKLCLSMGITRELLNITPSPNGLVRGDFDVVMSDADGCESHVQVRRYNGPSLIPVGRSISRVVCFSEPSYILIVEKEAVFANISEHLPDAIVITGKGFPDHYTRKFLYALHQSYPCTPIYGLVDSDVAGLQILRLYQSPSGRSVEYHHPIESIKWLGVGLLDYTDGWLDLAPHERKRISAMFHKRWLLEPSHHEWKRELQRQLFMGKKAEMNVLDADHTHRLANYVREKVKTIANEAMGIYLESRAAT